MGIGMVVIVPARDSAATLKIIEKHDQAYQIGKVQNDIAGKVIIHCLNGSTIEL